MCTSHVYKGAMPQKTCINFKMQICGGDDYCHLADLLVENKAQYIQENRAWDTETHLDCLKTLFKANND